MKLLFINQPPYNRGDESAHRGLLRALLEARQDVEVTVLTVSGFPSGSLDDFNVGSPRVKYMYVEGFHKGWGRIMKLGQITRLHFVWNLHPLIHNQMKFYKDTDLVVCCPGGMCMGGFYNWVHVFNLQLAKYMGKPLAYYGRSIGPFSTETWRKRLFRRLSMEMMNYFSYFSLRDKKSEKIAYDLGMRNYIGVVDSAFLDSPKVEIPEDVKKQIGGSEYFVFVPNTLIWHPAYKNKLDANDLLDFYCRALDEMFECFPGCKALLLPQTFNPHLPITTEMELFKDIAKRNGNKDIVVVSDRYGSDIQQTLIADARMVVGARYHSIMFALNNAAPFISLSYEHKMSGLLETLGKTDCMIDIEHSLETAEGRQQTLDRLREMLPLMKRDEAARTKAKQIARHGFDEFLKFLDKAK